MFRKSATVLAAVAATAAVAAPSAQAIGGYQQAQFDIAAMAAGIESELGQVTGWAYAIAKNGKLAASDADGKARTAVDGDVDMTTGSRMEIWSATKTFTAAAALKLLEAHPVAHVDSTVGAYLPAGWAGPGFGAGAGNVTFRQLLNHTSGLGQVGDALTQAEQDAGVWNTTWSGNQYAVQKGTNPGSSYNYTNMNYALLRVLNARLWRDTEPWVPAQTAANTGTLNLAYVNSRLLAPAGIASASCLAADAQTAVLHYNAGIAQPAAGFLSQLDGTSNQACAGHRGLHLSAMDMLRFQAHLAHGTIVSASVRSLMDSGRLGWNPNSNSAGNPGVYWHGGDGFLGGGREGHTCHMKFPNGIEATLIINSSRTGMSTTQCGTLLQAWQNAG